jgi:catalase (peroxidase I)
MFFKQFHRRYLNVISTAMILAVISWGSCYCVKNSTRASSQITIKSIRKLEDVKKSGASCTRTDGESNYKVPILQATHGLQLPGYPLPAEQVQYETDLLKINWTEVAKDLAALLKDSKDWWPADYGSYGPLMMRLSWHACGSYRTSDGRGGCDGGAQRFDPERSWPDNTNLDKARRLLEPIKAKYGNGLSWGDLFALVGTVAIREMGGPDIGFCAGRQDVQGNSQTIQLGPSFEQEQFHQCPMNGQCTYPLGSNTLGLVRMKSILFSFSSSLISV